MNYLTERPSRVSEGLLDFPRTVEDLFQRFWGVTTAPRIDTWRPLVDIVETPQAYIVRAELPGVNADDVDVTLTADTLTIRGEKKVEERQKDENWALRERMYGAFERSFTFPTPVQSDGVEAEAHNGVLTIKVMKAKEAQPRKIDVKIH